MYLLTQDCFSCTSPLKNAVQWCVLRLTDIAGESVRATWALHGMDAHGTHIAAGDLLVCRPSSYCRLFRLGWREEEEEEGKIESKEGGMREREKCASLNTHTNIETSMYRVMCQQHQK